MSFNLGALDGLVSNLFLFGPAVAIFIGARHLVRRGFFGPHQH